MKCTYVITPAADRDLEECALYIGQDSPRSSQRFLLAAKDTFDDLAAMPMLGTACGFAKPHLQELRYHPIRGFENHLVFYRPTGEGVEIVRVLHGARDIPNAIDL